MIRRGAMHWRERKMLAKYVRATSPGGDEVWLNLALVACMVKIGTDTLVYLSGSQVTVKETPDQILKMPSTQV
jgi:hypothetical protein